MGLLNVLWLVFILIIVALVIGFLLDIIFASILKWWCNRNHSQPLQVWEAFFFVVIQLVTAGVIIYYINTSWKIFEDQNFLLPRLFFTTVLFGTQFTAWTNIRYIRGKVAHVHTF
jgi:ABC-type dipeptide/oligopeptide/nickel transport system permease subunit